MAGQPPPSGPRLAGRLTADLVLSAPQGFNAVKDYSISLRGAAQAACSAAEASRRCRPPAAVAAVAALHSCSEPLWAGFRQGALHTSCSPTGGVARTARRAEWRGA